MPELPEVETVARGVDARVRGQQILAVELSLAREPFKTDRDEMAEVLTGQRIARVYRVGKHIVFDLEEPATATVTMSANTSGTGTASTTASGTTTGFRTAPVPTPVAKRRGARAHWVPSHSQWIVHLGMTGRLLYSAAAVPVPPHTHARLSLASGFELRFVDARRFGRLALHGTAAAPAQSAPFTGPGQEPLSISPDDFVALFRGRKLSIKAALLNQKLLHGVGNIYADESLFWAGIRPTRIADSLSRARLLGLHEALQRVLRQAIELGGSSVSDYVDADGVRGFFQLEHRVYDRAGEPCKSCGAEIRKIVHAGRGTHYCPRCQR